MNNDNYNFWNMAFNTKAIDINMLRQAVKTNANPSGEISLEEFKEISGVDFEVKETTATPQTTSVTQPVTPVQPQQVTQ